MNVDTAANRINNFQDKNLLKVWGEGYLRPASGEGTLAIKTGAKINITDAEIKVSNVSITATAPVAKYAGKLDSMVLVIGHYRNKILQSVNIAGTGETAISSSSPALVATISKPADWDASVDKIKVFYWDKKGNLNPLRAISEPVI